MLDGSDAIADWPLLNAMINTASGASWVSIHHGGGVGIGRSIHAGQVVVADGTDLAAEKIARVLVNDPGTWSAIYPPLEHATWNGWTPTDLIFPFFLFIAGITTHLSLEARRARGDDEGALIRQVGTRMERHPA